MQVEDLLGLFSAYRQTPKGYLVACPIHSDKTPSVLITNGYYKDKPTIRIKCFAGCASSSIRAWIKEHHGMPNFIPEKVTSSTETPKGTFDKVYSYCDVKGNLKHQVVRFRNPKSFAQRHKSDGKWVYNMEGVERVLYRLKELKAAYEKNPDCHVFVVAGEKDVETLNSLGFVATTNCGGENSQWLDSYTEEVKGRNVILVPDNDIPGYQHVVKIASKIINEVKTLRIMPLPVEEEHEDVSDYVEKYGGTANDIKVLVTRTPNVKSLGVEYITKKYRYGTPVSEPIAPVKVKPQVDTDDTYDGDDLFDESDLEDDEPASENKSTNFVKAEFEFSDAINSVLNDAVALSDRVDISTIGLCKLCKGTGYQVYVDKIGQYLKALPSGDNLELEYCSACKKA